MTSSNPAVNMLRLIGLASLSFTFTVSQILLGKLFLDINGIKSFYDNRGWGNIQSIFRSAICGRYLMAFEIIGCLNS
jgi:hypothetical protein